MDKSKAINQNVNDTGAKINADGDIADEGELNKLPGKLPEGDLMPEKLPSQEDITKVERRVKNEEKYMADTPATKRES
jgi:hypothetical protein